MRKYIFCGLVAFCVGAFSLIGCLEEKEETLILEDPEERYVDINDPYSLQKGLKIPDSRIVNGELPEPDSGNRFLSSSISSIKVNSGSTVILPLIYEGGYGIRTVYIQIVGADGNYFSVLPVAVISGGHVSAYVSIRIPKNIEDGVFRISYNVADESGSISNVVTSSVEVTNEVVSCQNASEKGTSGLTFTTLYLGEEAGPVAIWYDTYRIPDRIDIYQGERWLTGTGTDPQSLIPPMCNCSSPLPGFVGQKGTLSFDFDPRYGTNITVVVSGCLNGGTSWEWILTQAPGC